MSHGSLETVVELSGIQRGLLAECLAAEGSAVYQVQSSFRLDGELDVPAMTRAWQILVARHQALRCSFFWEGLSTPVQAVHRSVSVPVRVVEGDEAGLPAIRAQDRAEPFDLRRPPHLRVTVVRLGPRRHELIWTRHHLQVDGWSQALLLGEVFRLYEAVRIVGQQGDLDDVALLGPRTRLAPFLAWQRQRRATAADVAAFWRPYLAGLAPADRFAGRLSREQAQCSAALEPDMVARITTLARRWQITPAALHQVAWGLVLAATRGSDPDVVFGLALATRPPELADADRMIGLHITTLPVRPRLRPDRHLADVAGDVHDHGRELLAWQHLSPAEVQAASPVRPPARLYDSIVVVGNYPAEVTGGDARASLTVSGVLGEVQNSLPLTLRVMPGPTTVAAVLHDTGAVTSAEAEALLDLYLTALHGITERPDRSVAELLTELAAQQSSAASELTALVDAALRHPAVAQAQAVPLGSGRVRLAVVPGGRAGERLQAALRAAPGCELPLFTLPDGMVVAHEDATMTRALYHEIVVDEAYLQDGIVLADGSVVLDVGANVGLFLVWAATRWQDVQVHGYEPIPTTAQRARWNAAVWAPGSTVTAAGLGASPGQATFLHYPRMSGASGQHADPQRDAEGMLALALAQTVEAPPLAGDAEYVRDQLADRWSAVPVEATVTTVSAELQRLGLERVDLLKIDAEGSELDVLAGVAAEDWPRIHQVVLEAHTPALAEACGTLLRDQGFQVAVSTVGFHAGTDVTTVSAVRAEPVRGARPPRRLHTVSSAALAEEVGAAVSEHIPEQGEQVGGLVPNRAQEVGGLVPNRAQEVGGLANRVQEVGRRAPNRTPEVGGLSPKQAQEVGRLAPNRAPEVGAARAGLSLRQALEVVVLPDLPRAPDGSFDVRAVAALPGQAPDGAAAAEVGEAHLRVAGLGATADLASGPPASALEQVVAMVWRELLPGTPTLDRTDSFFDLGGHSLMAIQATARLRSVLALPIPLDALFEHPTVAGLAAELSTRAGDGAADLEQTASIVLDVATMSDAEVAEAMAGSTEVMAGSIDVAGVVAGPAEVVAGSAEVVVASVDAVAGEMTT